MGDDVQLHTDGAQRFELRQPRPHRIAHCDHVPARDLGYAQADGRPAIVAHHRLRRLDDVARDGGNVLQEDQLLATARPQHDVAYGRH